MNYLGQTANNTLVGDAEVKGNLEVDGDLTVDGDIEFKEVVLDNVDIKGSVSVDTITEYTPGAGVRVDSVLLLDNTVGAASGTFTTDIKTNVISERTGNTGVTVDDVLLKDGDLTCIDGNFTTQVRTDNVGEYNVGNGVLVSGVLHKIFDVTGSKITASDQVVTDTINEYTATAGVTIDNVLLKDNEVTCDVVHNTGSIETDVINEQTLNDGVTISDIINVKTAQISIGGVGTTYTLPVAKGTSGQILQLDGSDNLQFVTSATGDVAGPASAVNDNITTFNGTTGKIIKDSGVAVGDIATNTTDIAKTATLQNDSASSNTLAGQAGAALAGGTSNVLVGFESGDAITTGASNTLVGYISGNAFTDGVGNVGVGYAVGKDMENYCTGVGYEALTNASGSYNTGVGYQAIKGADGDDNTAIGREAGESIINGSNNTFIGALTVGSASLSNQIAIGYQAACTSSNQCTIGNASLTMIRPGSNGGCDLGQAGRQWGDCWINGTLFVDTIDEDTTDTGVTVDGVLLKDSVVTTTDLLKVISSSDAQLWLRADTDNVSETDNPAIIMSQDGGLTVSGIGMDSGNGMTFHTGGTTGGNFKYRFYVGGTCAQQNGDVPDNPLYSSDGALALEINNVTVFPGTDDSVSLGKATEQFKDLHLSGNANINGDFKYNNGQFEAYSDIEHTTTISASDTWTPCNFTSLTDGHSIGFTVDTTTTIGEITYTGTRDRHVHCGVTVTCRLATGGNDQLSFSVFDTTGTPTIIPGSSVDLFVGNNSNESQSTAIHFFPTLSENDKFRLYCKNVTATDNIIIKHVNMFGVATPAVP